MVKKFPVPHAVPEDGSNLALLRSLAHHLDCMIEEDFQLLAQITPSTAEAWRKRHKGPPFTRLGNRVLYPRKAVAKYLEGVTPAVEFSGKAFL